MGLWTWFRGDNDPLKDIDPALRRYLEKEAPKQYKPTPNDVTQSEPRDQSPRHQSFRDEKSFSQQLDDALTTGELVTQKEQIESRPLPKEAVFRDGRYKDLWKNYRPLAETEEAGKSDQEKLLDLAGGYRERQADIGRAAMENCSNEQWAVHECFRSGGWASRMTMCRSENRELENCVMMQRKFLRALGYMSLYERPEEESEKIQLHADTLYRRMLEQEKAIDEAKAKGLPPPELPSLMISAQRQDQGSLGPQAQALQTQAEEEFQPPSVGPVTFATLPQHLQEKYQRERFEGLEGPRLELAKQELDQEIAMKHTLVSRLDDRYQTERRDRLQRQTEGRERMSDKVKRWLDFRDWSKVDEEMEMKKS